MAVISSHDGNGRFAPTTEVLDEFNCEIRRRRSGKVIKAKREFHTVAARHIAQCVTPCYRKYEESLRTKFVFDSAEACINAFFLDKKASLISAIDDGRITDDRSFDRLVAAAAANWIAGLFERRTERGRKRDLLRQRMTRDKQHRFVNHGNNRWGLVGGPESPTQEKLVSLKMLALKYPVDIDYEKFADPNREKDPAYGQTGQLEDMLEGILEAANGTLTLSELLSVVQFRVAPLRTLSIVSMDENPEHPLDAPDTQAVDPAEAVGGWDEEDIEQLKETLAEELEPLKGKDRKKWLKEHGPLLERLIGGPIPSK